MFRTQWIESLNNKWYKFELPISLKLELIIISILKECNSIQDVLSLIASEVLSVSIKEIEEELTYHQLTSIVNLVIPQVTNNSINDSLDQLSSDELDKIDSPSYSISRMMAFLSYHGKIQPSEVLNLPRVIVMEMMKEVTELLSTDKKMEYELSIVSALSKIFGSKNSSTSTSNSVNNNTIDLSNIDTDDLVNKLGTMEGITGAIKVEK